MKKCIIYSRVSSDHQDYSSQVTELKTYAKLLSLEVDRVFSEKVSGYDPKAERVQFELMKAYLKETDIKIVLMWELSRIARTTLKSLQEIKTFTEQGIDIYFKKEGINTLSDNPSTKLLLSVMSTMAEVERDNIVSRVKRGLEASAKKGKITGYQTLPYGYKSDDGFLAVDEEEAKIIQLIFSKAKEGLGMRGIASLLNSTGVQSRWKKLGRVSKNRMGKTTEILWKPNSIGLILRNETYIGIRKYRKETIVAPSIIDKDLFDEVQKLLDTKPGLRKGRTKHTYLIRGKLFCAHCGRAFGAITEARYNAPSFYFCNGAKDIEIRCKVGQYKSSFMDKVIYDALFLHRDMYSTLANAKKAETDPAEKEQRIEFYKEEIKKGNDRLTRVLELFKGGMIDKKELTKDRDAILRNRAEYEGNIEVLQGDLDTYKNTVIKVEEIYNTYAPEQSVAKRQSFIDKYLDKVTLKKIENPGVDFEKLATKDVKDLKSWEIIVKGEPTKKSHSRFAYIEIYAFGSKIPLKGVIQTSSGILHLSQNYSF